ncbi:ParB N-terminal domain-containing protein [Nocardia gamkensis]|uniref:ParB N-terminal domain-containing protein n=1 Tax=Nocardia gamkensis TaxID=352869 RepID=A0A7X6L5T3_9NOCA|nr:ParB N-terminal domain-containing protein [Nocardia gamkensis]NKY28247.1 ParB N-terminal domain-containing protein [Nocardia gamkensis]NQE70730.1 Transcriptional regulator NovG [Nocardia gamkensis]
MTPADHWDVICAPTTVAVGSIRISGSPRLVRENLDHIRAMIQLDTPMPPIIVHRPSMCVIDGIHRLRAAKLRGDTHILTAFFDGTAADAFVLALKANVANGLPLSLTERTAAARRILGTHPHWSDRAIARYAGLSAKTVSSIRQRSSVEIPHSNARSGQDGRVRPLDSAEGRRLAGQLILSRPDASLREIAKEAGISASTVLDVRDRLRRGDDPIPEARVRGRPEKSARHEDAVSAMDAMRSLGKDPTVRFNESGRTLLRLLNFLLMDAETRDRLIDNVPPHCTEAVAAAARGCAAAWQQFAVEVQNRHADGAEAIGR